MDATTLPGAGAEARQVHQSREDLHGVLRELLEHVVREMGAAGGSLALLEDSAGDVLTVVASVGEPRAIIGTLIKADQGLTAGFVDGGYPSLPVDDARAPREFGEAMGSSLTWPLKLNDRIAGALWLSRSSRQGAFVAGDLERAAKVGNVVGLVIENQYLHLDQQRRIDALTRLNTESLEMNARILEMNSRLEDAQHQLLQSEKMASIGHLAAGVAHEINNPIGFVHSNLGSLEAYLHDIFALLSAYEALEHAPGQAQLEALQRLKRQIDLAFLRSDIIELMRESRDGISRVKKIVQDLKDFSHQGDEQEWQWVLLHKGLDSTLNIVNNEIKYKAKVVREYGEIPEIQCRPSQLNQVFMNLLVNAAHAIEESGTITVRTGKKEAEVWVEFADTGHGIAKENLQRIFDPFFTTKPVGKGTGLGLSLSYGIVQKHRGRIEVESEPGKGTTFRVCLPVRQDPAPSDPAGARG